METIYFAGGCLWGVQAFIKTLNGVISTEAGRANGTTNFMPVGSISLMEYCFQSNIERLLQYSQKHRHHIFYQLCF
nr:peptide-methionine (S)-S-oxide reductase [uncultured Sellimonas sp.]